jgi:hypothetical protein
VLEKFAGQLGPLGAETLSLHAHPHSRGVAKARVVSVPEHLRWSDLVAAAHAAEPRTDAAAYGRAIDEQVRFLQTGIDGLFTDQCDVAVIARAEVLATKAAA